jgi:cysteine desulfurase / selenocysteine lyase
MSAVAELLTKVGPVLREALVGIDQPVPLLDGRLVPYVNLDNAASTPAFRSVVETVDEFLPLYSGVHRGTGYKSRVSTAAFEQARDIVGQFLGADAERDVVVFTKNTTEAINKLARALPVADDSVILTTLLEHHSNDLPWRARARTVHVGLRPDGALDLDDLDRLLTKHAGRVALLAVSGASNVTGLVPPVHDLAERVHAAGGRILVDAAQLAAHRRIDMRSHDDPGHLDFVVLSAHKMYAPYGTGALVGARSGFGATPDQPGGGTIQAVTTDAVAWADLPYREEAGSPNVLGAIALAAAIRTLTAIGLERIAGHERELTRYAIDRLSGVAGLRIHGPTGSPDLYERLGVISFSVGAIDHALVAALLCYEHGVGVRSGCFCAQPYLAHLLNVDRAEAAAWVDRANAGRHPGVPGMVWISLGCYNDTRDIDAAVHALDRVAAGEIGADYRADSDGAFHPAGYTEPMLFSLE